MNKKGKKVILVDIFFQYLAQTGIKTYTDSLLSQIDAYDGEEYTFIIYPSREKMMGSKFFKGKTARWKNWWFQIRYFSHKLIVLPFLSLWYKADLVFSPDILSPIWSRGKRVSVIHDAFFWETPEHYNALWRKIYLFFLQKSVDSGARVLTVSHYAKSKISNYLKTSNPITAIPTGLDLKVRAKMDKEHSHHPNPYFLHVGVMEKRKNLPTLIKAFAIFSEMSETDYSLVLVGQRGPREALDDYPAIMDLVKKYQLEDKVIFPGYLDAVKLSTYYQFAEAYVFPSTNEGFGLPVLEAFSYGLPVIVGPQGALQEVGGEAVLVSSSFDAEDFSRVMFQLSTDEALRHELSESGFKRLSLFTGEKFFLSLLGYFKRMINE
ncbi:glycosyltransferase family 4 protein [Cyclobacterium qasimii]|uniref:Glycosyl transferase, group 1 n=2 Tax=Cyclobacterium qasimii TaxID=1350429 RepID=S7WLW0_9BACT|nr:glycosyltransferase family 1 protein [Cyclobacterium qasimii]EPR65193.1 glycosyl transferase, group 1 [Cyclobacterium qasimii M12-11B]GEO21992.1 glycosyl transferase [Cyclobacterium qasimii]